MISFPNAKINLGLRVLDKRPDGFHNIETIFYPAALCDVLEIVPSKTGLTTFETTGISIPGREEDNLCLKTFNLLSSAFFLPPVTIHLHKVIPPGSGLGGGSSDAAFTIRMLNDLFQLGLTTDQMIEYAGKLGSDCAFFIENTPVFAHGKGDQFDNIALNLEGYRIEVVTPGIHVNTSEAYGMIDEMDKRDSRPVNRSVLKESIRQPIPDWRYHLYNDFEVPVFHRHPELAIIKQELYDRGAIYAAMSGSGSALFGIFKW